MNTITTKTGFFDDNKISELLLKFFDVEPYKLIIVSKKYRSHTVTSKEKRANDLPLLSEFCASIGLSTSKLNKYAKSGNFPRLQESIERARDIQRNMLILNGLEGLYDVRYAEFVAINTVGMRKTQHVESNIKTNTGVKVYLPQVQSTGKEPLKNVTDNSTIEHKSLEDQDIDSTVNNKDTELKDVNV